jgi:hypothetical protein
MRKSCFPEPFDCPQADHAVSMDIAVAGALRKSNKLND